MELIDLRRAEVSTPRVGPWRVRGWRAALRTARGVGRALEWVTRGGRLALLSLALVPIGMFIFEWWKVLLVYIAALLLWAAFSARARIVIEKFEDHTSLGTPLPAAPDGSPPPHDDAAGTATLLASRLGEMRNLYRDLDDSLDAPSPDLPIDAGVQLADIGDALRSAFTTQSNLSVGPVTVPIGAFMALVGGLVQAPRLRGAVYGDDQRVVMTAELSSGGRDYTWRVEKNLAGDDTYASAREEMVRELAYRVFAELSLHRQAEWPATQYWLEALEERRACRRSPRDRRLHLKRAQEKLRNALARDERFYLAAYHLGLVYRELAAEDARRAQMRGRTGSWAGNPAANLMAADGLRAGERAQQPYLRSAVRTFEHAIGRIDSARWEAYYGLALVRWSLIRAGSPHELRRCARVITACQRAMDLKPGRAAAAQILDLQALALAKMGRRGLAIDTRHRALSAALRELAIAELLRVRADRAETIARLSKQAAQCVLNLAVVYDEFEEARERPRGAFDWIRPRPAGFRAILALQRFATRLADIDADGHARFAKMAEGWAQDDIARAEIEKATRVDPQCALYWAQLARYDAADPVLAAIRCEQAERTLHIDSDDERDQQAVAVLRATYRELDGERGDNLRATVEARSEIETALSSADPDAELHSMLEDYTDKGNEWGAAHVEVELARRKSDHGAGAAEEAEDLLRSAIKCLRRVDPAEIRRHGLLGELALAITSQGSRSAEALAAAEQGVALDPLTDTAWVALATVCQRAGNWDREREAREQALHLNPDDPERHIALALARWRQGRVLSGQAARRKMHTAALRDLDTALVLYDSAEVPERRRAHWWCAACHRHLGQFSEIPPHLQYILASVEKPKPSPDDLALMAVVECMLALAYRRIREYGEAEKIARAAIRHGDLAFTQGHGNTMPSAAQLGDEGWPLGLVRAFARLQLAGCHADRVGDLEEAETKVNEAEDLIEELGDRQPYAAGYVHAERGRALLAGDDNEGAIKQLTRSTRIDPRASDVYLDLAVAYERFAREPQAPGAAAAALQSARASVMRAKELAGEGHDGWAQAVEVEARLDALEGMLKAFSEEAETRPDEVTAPVDGDRSSGRFRHA